MISRKSCLNSKMKQDNDSLFFSVRSTTNHKVLSREEQVAVDLLAVNTYVAEDQQAFENIDKSSDSIEVNPFIAEESE